MDEREASELSLALRVFERYWDKPQVLPRREQRVLGKDSIKFG